MPSLTVVGRKHRVFRLAVRPSVHCPLTPIWREAISLYTVEGICILLYILFFILLTAYCVFYIVCCYCSLGLLLIFYVYICRILLIQLLGCHIEINACLVTRNFNENWHECSSCEWALLKRLSRSRDQ